MKMRKVTRSNTVGLLVVGSIVAIALTGCEKSVSPAVVGGTNEAGVSANQKVVSAPVVAISASPSGGDAATTIHNAMQLLSRQKAYLSRSTSVADFGDRKPAVTVHEFVSPDRTHTIEPDREIITIGKTMYVKEEGKWKNLGTQMSDMQAKIAARVRDMSAAERANATKGLTSSYKSLPDEMQDGKATAVYEMHSQLDMPSQGGTSLGVVTITKYWIGKPDGLLRKEESNGNVAGAKMKTTTIYEYDPNIKIEAPI
jgi:hypothetical protein